MDSDDLDEFDALMAGDVADEVSVPLVQLRRELFEIRELLLIVD
jgi:hypothetical protein